MANYQTFLWAGVLVVPDAGWGEGAPHVTVALLTRLLGVRGHLHGGGGQQRTEDRGHRGPPSIRHIVNTPDQTTPLTHTLTRTKDTPGRITS